MGFVLLHKFVDLLHPAHDQGSLFPTQLSAYQVHGLDAVGPFVDGGDLHVPAELFHGIFAAVPVPAVNLDGPFGQAEGHVGGIGFHHRDQQIDGVFADFLLLRVRGHLGQVGVVGRLKDEGPEAFGVGFHGNEHAAHVGMVDDRHPGGVGVFHLADIHPLNSFLGVFQGIQVSQVPQGESLQAHAQAGFIHHLEHELNPLALLPQDVAVAFPFIPEVQGGGRRAFQPHLVFDAAAIDIVGFSQGAVRVDADLGDDEEAQALDSRGSVFRAGQDGVDDIGRQVVVARGDEDLRALDQIMISLLLGRAFRVPHGASGLGFGKAHGPGPLPGVHLFQVRFFLLRGPETLDQVGTTPGQPRIGGERAACSHEHFRSGKGHGIR
jgi:hypothetical protein